MVRKHIDVLIGEYLSTPVQPRISCKDKETLSNIERAKQLQIHNEIVKELKSHLQNILYNTISGDQKAVDKEVENRILNIKESIDRNFISEYELAGQNIVN